MFTSSVCIIKMLKSEVWFVLQSEKKTISTASVGFKNSFQLKLWLMLRHISKADHCKEEKRRHHQVYYCYKHVSCQCVEERRQTPLEQTDDAGSAPEDCYFESKRLLRCTKDEKLAVHDIFMVAVWPAATVQWSWKAMSVLRRSIIAAATRKVNAICLFKEHYKQCSLAYSIAFGHAL